VCAGPSPCGSSLCRARTRPAHQLSPGRPLMRSKIASAAPGCNASGGTGTVHLREPRTDYGESPSALSTPFDRLRARCEFRLKRRRYIIISLLPEHVERMQAVPYHPIRGASQRIIVTGACRMRTSICVKARCGSRREKGSVICARRDGSRDSFRGPSAQSIPGAGMRVVPNQCDGVIKAAAREVHCACTARQLFQGATMPLYSDKSISVRS
jgi:hypothetical protein